MPAVLEELQELFIRLARIPSPTGSERAIADAVTAHLRDLGLAVQEDDSAAATGCGCGNLVVRIPGTGDQSSLALCAHLDTVPIDRSPEIVVEDGVVHTDGATILGADDKAAVAVLLLLARDLAAQPPAASVELVFTAGEELGLLGAKALAPGAITAPLVFVFDSEGAPGAAIVSAPATKVIDARFRGAGAHAGIEPEKGRSAVVAAAHAVAAMRLGRIDDETTANVGVFEGGTAANVVPEQCRLEAEARSHDPAKLARQVGDMMEAIATAATNAAVDVSLDVRESYRGYAHDPDGGTLAVVAAATAAAGLDLRLVKGGGGSDSNVFNARGLPAVTLGVGFENVHSAQERLRVSRLEELYHLAHALVRAAGPAA